MMNSNAKIALTVAGALVLGAGSMWVFMGGVKDDPAQGKTLVSRRIKSGKAKPGAKQGAQRKKKGATALKIAISNQKRLKPSFALGEEEEKKLTEEQRRIIEEIRAALRADDFKTLMRLVRKMQASNEWPDGIPKAVKLAAVDALGWFGGNCLPELVAFLADADNDVISATVDAWEDAIAECEADYEVADQVKFACKVVRNAESMDSILSEIPNMRHSVGISTIKEVLANGNDVAKAQIQEIIDDFTGETGITTAEQLDEWLAKNPDDPDDEAMYGKLTDDGDDD